MQNIIITKKDLGVTHTVTHVLYNGHVNKAKKNMKIDVSNMGNSNYIGFDRWHEMSKLLSGEQLWILSGSILWVAHKHLKKYNDLGWKFREPKDPAVRKAQRYIMASMVDIEDAEKLYQIGMDTFENGKAEYQKD